MKFAWGLFKKALSPILLIAGLFASKSKAAWDDEAVALAKNLAGKFLPGEYKEGQWVGSPLTNLDDKAAAVKAIAAVYVKQMFINPKFQKRAALTPEQAGTTLVAALSYIKPDAVDTEQEIIDLLKEAGQQLAG